MENKEKSNDFTKAVLIGTGLGIALSPIIKHIVNALPQIGGVIEGDEKPIQIGEHDKQEKQEKQEKHHDEQHEEHEEKDENGNVIQKALKFYKEHHGGQQ